MRVRIVFGALCVAALWLFATDDQAGARRSAAWEHGLMVEEFRRFARALPALPVRIDDVRFFRGPGGHFPAGIVMSIVVKGEGWQLLVFMREPGHEFRLVWKSGILDDGYANSWDEFRIVHFGEEDIVQVTGCRIHACRDVFSVVMYVPSKNRAFRIHYDGYIIYPPELGAPENRQYKQWLEGQVRERLARSP